MVALNELLNYLQPGPFIVSFENYGEDYAIPVLTAGKTFLLGYTNDKKGVYHAKSSPIILFDDFTTATKWVDFDFKVKSSACKILVPKEGVNLRYVFYAMQAIQFDASEHRRYWIKDYSATQINYPDREKQEDVVRVLDTIESEKKALVASIDLLDEQVKSLFNKRRA